jgi:adenylosuccinate lyase
MAHPKILCTAVAALLCITIAARAGDGPAPLSRQGELATLFSDANLNGFVLELEAALARAQARHGVIPEAAAEAITRAAVPENLPLAAWQDERARVRHRMVALLNVLRRSLDAESAEYLHFGATTVDLYDSARMLQVDAAIDSLIDDLEVIEMQWIDLARRHRDTVMIGRTLGQHALPITFGKKISGYIGENRRHIDRLRDLSRRVERSIIMKGAVGSYLGLGAEGRRVEASMADELGLPAPYPDDWHASRDVFAEYALVLSMIARTYGRFGQEIFLMQMTDIAELVEVRPGSAVGSSTMPHKNNPSRSSALRQHARSVPRLAEIVADDMINYFERDNTSRPNRAIEDVSLAAEDLLIDASRLIARLEIDPVRMRENLDLSGGWIMTQRLVFALGERLGREHAEARLRALADRARNTGATLREAIEADAELRGVLDAGQLDALLDPETYLGLDGELVDAVIAEALSAREADTERRQKRAGG